MYLQRAAFDGSAALEQLGQIDTDGPESGLAQLLGEAGRSGGQHHVEAVGHDVEPEHVRRRRSATSMASGKQLEQRRPRLAS